MGLVYAAVDERLGRPIALKIIRRETDTFTRHAWLDPLRDRPDFIAILQKAERRHNEARGGIHSGRG